MSQVVNQVNNKASRITMLQLLASAYSWYENALLETFRRDGIASLGKADLKLLANLNCGTTYASELARRMGVTRQGIGKLLRNLIAENLVRLEAVPHQRNTKQIVITPRGQKLITKAVTQLDALEEELVARIGKTKGNALRRALETDWGEPPV